MNSNITKPIIFFIPILIFLIAGEIVLRISPNAYSSKYQSFIRSEEKVEILVLGGSNAHYGINPWLMDKYTYNLAMISQSMLYNSYLLKKYIDKTPNLKTVIIPITYSSVFKIDGTGEDNWRRYYYYHFYDHCPVLMPLVSIEKFSVLKTLSAKTFLEGLLHSRKMEISDQKGWAGGYKGHVPDFKISGMITAKRHENGSLKAEQNLLFISEMIKLCSSKNISVVLLYTPNLPQYINCLDKRKLHIMFTSIDSMALKYRNVRILNYYSSAKFNENDFFDCDHLNYKGAAKFTTLLNSELKRDTLKYDKIVGLAL